MVSYCASDTFSRRPISSRTIKGFVVPLKTDQKFFGKSTDPFPVLKFPAWACKTSKWRSENFQYSPPAQSSKHKPAHVFPLPGLPNKNNGHGFSPVTRPRKTARKSAEIKPIARGIWSCWRFRWSGFGFWGSGMDCFSRNGVEARNWRLDSTKRSNAAAIVLLISLGC